MSHVVLPTARDRAALAHVPPRADGSRPWLGEGGNGRPPAVSEQHAAARFWASHGLPVCRLIPADKRPTDRAPRTTGMGPQHRRATTDVDVIDEWWREVDSWWGPRARCNPGLPTGAWPGYLALDVDRPDAFAAWVAARPLPPTLRWSSCRPDHPERHTLLFKYPSVDFAIRSVVDGRPCCVPGVDIRADSEHVVLPGARHALGSIYVLQRNALVTALPTWFLAELSARFQPSRSRRAGRPARSLGAPTRPANALAGPPAVAHAQAYSNALQLFERAASRASCALGHRHHTLVGLVWEGLARGLRPTDVGHVVRGYVDRACPEQRDHAEALRQLAEALARPKACRSNRDQFTVAGQLRRLLSTPSARQGQARSDGPCRRVDRRAE